MERRDAIDSEAGAERYPAARAFDLRELGAVFAGGVLGALARAGLGELLSAHPGRWPWATFIVNMAGATLLGYAIARLSLHTRPSPRVRAFVAGGVCGTLTTFSAMMLELLRMLDAGRVGLAFGYATASVCGALALVLVAGAAARRHVAVDAS